MKIFCARFFFALILQIFCITTAWANLQVGDLVYRTSDNEMIYGKDGLVGIYNAIKRPGHVAIYIGPYFGVESVVEAYGFIGGPLTQVIITSLEYFTHSNGQVYLGAKRPVTSPTPTQIDNIVALTLAQVGEEYDVNFWQQKGPNSGDWTCVGFAEKIYESANSNSTIVQDGGPYAINITPDGYTYTPFSQDTEFSSLNSQIMECVSNPSLTACIDTAALISMPLLTVMGRVHNLEGGVGKFPKSRQL